MTDFAEIYLKESVEILHLLSIMAVEKVVAVLAETRKSGGRVFVLGVGGSAASGSHLVNDLRKLTGIEAYCATDNVSELTARTNDEGWDTVFSGWLRGSRLGSRDVVFVLSVGGGDASRNISPNLVKAIDYAKEVRARVVGIVGRDGGYTGTKADAVVIIPVVSPDRITPHTESMHALVGHMIVSHPSLKAAGTKWESVPVKN